MATRKELRFKEITSEIGELVVKWTYLEFVLERLIWGLSGLGTYEECDVFLAGTDVRQKVQIAKSLAVLRPIDERWKERCIAALDKAGNEYRIARNETIHSQWFHTPRNGIRRRRIKIKISKPAYAQREITTIEEIRPNLQTMRTLSKSIANLAHELELMFSYSGVWMENTEGLRAISYAQYLRLVRSESRRRMKKTKR